MKKAQLVFIPSPGIGHLVPKIVFAKRLLDRDDRISITVVIINPPTGGPDVASYTKSVAATDTRIRFINVILPTDQLPPSIDFDFQTQSPEKIVAEFIASHKPYVKDAIINHVVDSLAGLVVDLFCTSMIDVANELGVPSYLFFTSTAAFLGLMLYLPKRHDQIGLEFDEESDTDSIIPSYVNPVPNGVLPSVLFNKNGGYISFQNHGRRFKEAKGIIINTYAKLESHAVKSLSSDNDIPPVYTVGPLIDLKNIRKGNDDDQVMKWLDDQPDSSVVFLCFGSMGSFSEDQLKEIAFGLEQSGSRFLWCVRKAPPKDKFKMPSDYTCPYDDILPDGFLERTKNIGLVCGWVSQVEVLAHKSIGGFVSHCGWNSILESLWFGVPIVTWPIYAEQQINAFEMVRDLGLAVELKLDYRNGGDDVVLADDIARAIRCVMDGDNKVRKRAKEESEKSRSAVSVGGSSFAAYGSLIEDILGKMP